MLRIVEFVRTNKFKIHVLWNVFVSEPSPLCFINICT